jgi:ATP-dependent Lon protease
MRDFRDAKAMAQTLREALHAKSVFFTHSESQELIANILGFRDWNVLAARIRASQPAITPVRDNVPADANIPVFPMRDLVLFPHMIAPIFVGRDKTRRAVERAMAGDRRVLVVAQRHGADNDPDRLEALYPIGVTASIIDRQTQVDGVLKVSVSGLRRMAIVRLINGEFLAAEAAPIEEERCESREATILSRAVLDAYQVYANLDFSSLSTAPKARFGLPSIGDPGLLADTLAPLLSIGVEQRQQLLEASDIVSRLEKILDLMNSSGPAN